MALYFCLLLNECCSPCCERVLLSLSTSVPASVSLNRRPYTLAHRSLDLKSTKLWFLLSMYSTTLQTCRHSVNRYGCTCTHNCTCTDTPSPNRAMYILLLIVIIALYMWKAQRRVFIACHGRPRAFNSCVLHTHACAHAWETLALSVTDLHMCIPMSAYVSVFITRHMSCHMG